MTQQKNGQVFDWKKAFLKTEFLVAIICVIAASIVDAVGTLSPELVGLLTTVAAGYPIARALPKTAEAIKGKK